MQIKNRYRRILLAILACQLLIIPQSISAQAEQENQTHEPVEDTTQVDQELREALETYATDNPAFQEALDVYWKLLESEAITFRDITELDGKGSTTAAVEETIETDVEPRHYVQDNLGSYIVYVFELPAGENTENQHVAEILVYFTDNNLEYIGLSSVTMNFSAERVLAEDDAILYSEPGTPFEDFIALEPVFVGVSHNRFKGENYTSLSFPSFTGFDDLMYEFTLFNEDKEVVYNYIVNSSNHQSQASSYLMNLSQEYFKQTVEQDETNSDDTNEAASSVDEDEEEDEDEE